MERCRAADMSAAFESICESTSHKETISTGDTCTSRNRSDFPYHPQPIKPTRRRLSRSYSCAGARAAAANPKAVVWRNSRRFIGIPAKRKQFPSIRNFAGRWGIVGLCHEGLADAVKYHLWPKCSRRRRTSNVNSGMSSRHRRGRDPARHKDRGHARLRHPRLAGDGIHRGR